MDQPQRLGDPEAKSAPVALGLGRPPSTTRRRLQEIAIGRRRPAKMISA